MSHVYATYVPGGHEGISRNVEALTRALARHGVEARLDAPAVHLEEMNARRVYLTGGWAAQEAVRRALADPSVDVVHYHTNIPSMALFARLARARLRGGAARKPLVVHPWNAFYRGGEAHGAAPLREVAFHTLFNNPGAALAGLRGADAVVVSSRFQQRQFREAGCAAPVHVIANGVDAEALHPASPEERALARAGLGLQEGPVLLYYGHLSTWKGVDHLLEALPRVLRDAPELQVLLSHTSYGRGEAWLAGRLAALRLAGRVRVQGPADVPTLLAAADLAALPYTAAVGTACYPNVLLECLAAGVPVVATRAGAVPEAVVHGHTALLARPADPADLAEQVARLAGDAALRARLAKAGRREAVARFDWDKAARSHAELYRALVLAPAPPPPAMAEAPPQEEAKEEVPPWAP